MISIIPLKPQAIRALSVLAACIVIAATSACRTPESESGWVRSPPATDDAAHAAVDQARIGAFYHAVLIPRLKDCWNGVQGKGEIVLTFTYHRQADQWIWTRQDIAGSSLSQEADTAAARCMEAAARGTTLAMTSDEQATANKAFIVHWGWPVPLPANTAELAVINPGPGGGGGPNEPRCYDCKHDLVTHRSSCAVSNSGYSECKEDGTGTGCFVKLPRCLTGSSGGRSGIILQ